MAIALVISTTREKSCMNWARTCIWITIYFIKNYKRQIYKTKFPKYSHSHIFAFIVGIDLVTPETYRRHKGVAMHTTHKPCIDFLQCLECTDWSPWILRHFHPAMYFTLLRQWYMCSSTWIDIFVCIVWGTAYISVPDIRNVYWK